jgi:hypothetical protein
MPRRPKTQIPTVPGNTAGKLRSGFSNLPSNGPPRQAAGFSWVDGKSPSPIPATNGMTGPRPGANVAKLPAGLLADPTLRTPKDPKAARE